MFRNLIDLGRGLHIPIGCVWEVRMSPTGEILRQRIASLDEFLGNHLDALGINGPIAYAEFMQRHRIRIDQNGLAVSKGRYVGVVHCSGVMLVELIPTAAMIKCPG